MKRHQVSGRQADQQAEMLAEELARRGWNVRTYSAFQYTEPFIAQKVEEARGDGVEVVVALPLYPKVYQELRGITRPAARRAGGLKVALLDSATEPLQ